MPQATNGVADKYLWKFRLKINTPDGGLNQLLHFADKTYAEAEAAALKIGLAFKALMPSTCEIKRATLSKSNTSKDSKIVPSLLGDGLYLQSGVDPDPTTFNKFDDAIKVRMQNTDGGGVTLAIGPVPDTIIGGGEVILPITSVTDMTAADGALGAQPITYATEFTRLMLLIGKNCSRVVAALNNPGGVYDYYAFDSAHVIGVGRKKGGRVFVK